MGLPSWVTCCRIDGVVKLFKSDEVNCSEGEK